MRVKRIIDFKAVDWNSVDREKAKFFYDEALAFNSKLIDDINGLNGKALGIMGFILPIISAATGFWLGIWGMNGKEPLAAALTCAVGGLFIVLVFLILAVFPRGIYRGEGDPEAYFSGSLYKANLSTIYAGGIATLYKAVKHNYRVLQYRGKMLLAAMLSFITTFGCTVAVFLLSRSL